MNSSVKVGLALAAVVAVVFVVTVISQWTGTTVKPPDPVATAEPLRFDTDVAARRPVPMHYDPKSEERAYREFPGYFEKNSDAPAYFWFDNPNDQPVRLSALHRSCTSCTGMAVAVVPPAGPGGADPAVLAATGGAAEAAYQAPPRPPADGWQPLDFTDKTKTVEIPPHCRGVVRVVISIPNEDGPATKSATLGAAMGDMTEPRPYLLGVALSAVPAYAVYKTRSDPPVTLDEGDPPRAAETAFWSSTRTFDGPNRLDPPGVYPRGEPYVQADGDPVRLTADEMAALAEKISAERGGPVRVTAAYRVRMTVRRALPPEGSAAARELDIGPLERVADVMPKLAAEGTPAPAFTVVGTVRGAVGLERGGAVDLGLFETRVGVDRHETLVGTRAGLELGEVRKGADDPAPPDPKDAPDWVPPYTFPTFLKVRLDPPKDDGGRRTWELHASVDPPYGAGPLPAKAAVVLRVKATGQLVRIPVKGTGRQ